MKYIIKVILNFEESGSADLGYVGSIKYSFIEKAARDEVVYRDRYGEVIINKMFSIERATRARVYDTEAKLASDLALLRDNFSGLHYEFNVVPISEADAIKIRNSRKK